MTLIGILSRLKTVAVFIVLETLALAIVSNKSVFQRSCAVQLSMESSAFIYSKINDIYSYFALGAANKELSAYNAQLQNRIEQLQNAIGKQTEPIDSAYYDSYITFIPAKVINKSIGNIDNYFVLDRGSKDGVKEGFGVVSNGKVVGVVQYVSENFSAVLLVASSKMKLSGKIKKDNQLCTVICSPKTIGKGEIYDIPHHVGVAVGDTILTSGFSSIFPSDYIIGTVTGIKNNVASASNDLSIRYAIDFMRINYVDIVDFKNIDEINEIRNQINIAE